MLGDLDGNIVFTIEVHNRLVGEVVLNDLNLGVVQVSLQTFNVLSLQLVSLLNGTCQFDVVHRLTHLNKSLANLQNVLPGEGIHASNEEETNGVGVPQLLHLDLDCLIIDSITDVDCVVDTVLSEELLANVVVTENLVKVSVLVELVLSNDLDVRDSIALDMVRPHQLGDLEDSIPTSLRNETLADVVLNDEIEKLSVPNVFSILLGVVDVGNCPFFRLLLERNRAVSIVGLVREDEDPIAVLFKNPLVVSRLNT